MSAAERRPKQADRKQLIGQIGITTSSFGAQLSGRSKNGKFSLLELPRILVEELDLKVIDLNTSSLASTRPAYLERLREAADKAGCLLTNLKLNQRDVDLGSRDKAMREKAVTVYKASIDAAAALGLLWTRPLPTPKLGDRQGYLEAFRRLIDHAARRKVQMLVENYGWMQDDPDSVVTLIKELGGKVAACPDTGNWNSNPLRYQGLARTFPLAVSCDFKARELGPRGEHKLYDLERCYRIGRMAGFRGPWCLEHANTDTKVLLRELALVRDMLRKWMKT